VSLDFTRLRGRVTGRRSRRLPTIGDLLIHVTRSCWQLQAFEYTMRYVRSFDGGDESNRRAAAGTSECVDLEAVLQQGKLSKENAPTPDLCTLVFFSSPGS